MTIKDPPIRAKVHDVRSGKHGFYAVAVAVSERPRGSITFSLEQQDGVWQEDRHPNRGEIVLLSDVTYKTAGCRANKARLFRPSDEL